MYGKLLKALIHRPGPEFSNEANYRRFGYTGPLPVLAEAQAEHDAFAACLKEWGVEVSYMEETYPHCIGATYITDSALITDKGAIVSYPGKKERLGEEKAVAKRLLELGIPIYCSVVDPGRVEGGGETIWLDRHTLLIGSTYRTNTEAYQQFKKLLSPEIEVIQIQMPHYKGPGTVLHLGSVCSLLDKDLAVVYLPLMPVEMVRILQARNIQMIEITEEEFSHSASNILAVEPRKLIMLEGNPATRDRLLAEGCEVKEIPGKWTGYDRKAGPTCMTMSLLRAY